LHCGDPEETGNENKLFNAEDPKDSYGASLWKNIK
jgi:hypothetical protein